MVILAVEGLQKMQFTFFLVKFSLLNLSTGVEIREFTNILFLHIRFLTEYLFSSRLNKAWEN